MNSERHQNIDANDSRQRDPRVPLAAERTFLAWIRTGLALMGFGFVVARFGLFLREIAAASDPTAAAHHGYSLWIGTSLVALGIVVNLVAAINHARYLRALETTGTPPPLNTKLGNLVVAFLTALGIVTLIYLVTIR